MIGPAGGGALIEALVVARDLLGQHAADRRHGPAHAARGRARAATPRPTAAIDWVGIVLSAAGLGGPVFALIEQPTHGWGDPLVFVPLIAGVLLLRRLPRLGVAHRHPMLDLVAVPDPQLLRSPTSRR